MTAAISEALTDLEILQRYERALSDGAQPARIALAELAGEIAGRDYPTQWIEHLVAPYRAVVDHADRVAAFVARAQEGRVRDDDLAQAAEAVRRMDP